MCYCLVVVPPNRDKALDISGAPKSAVLIHKAPIMSGFLIVSIDNHPRPAGIIKRYELAPGEHAVVVELNEAYYQGDKVKIKFVAKPGEVYQIDADMKTKFFLTGYWWAWITEQSTGKRFDCERVTKKQKQN
jgi:hypothetical protein